MGNSNNCFTYLRIFKYVNEAKIFDYVDYKLWSAVQTEIKMSRRNSVGK